MKITLTHPDCPDTYQIRPYSQGTCLELIKNPDEVYTHTIKGRSFTTPKDKHPKYPSNLEHGLKLAVESMYMNPKCTDKEIEVNIKTESDKISKYFNDWLEKVKIDIEK